MLTLGFQLSALLSLVLLIAVLTAIKAGIGKSHIQEVWQKLGGLLIANLFAVAIGWGVLTLLWGFTVAAQGVGIIAVASFSHAVFGGFGGRWVGAGAAEREQADREWGQLMIVPAVAWLLLSMLLAALSSFSGFCPWRPFG